MLFQKTTSFLPILTPALVSLKWTTIRVGGWLSLLFEVMFTMCTVWIARAYTGIKPTHLASIFIRIIPGTILLPKEDFHLTGIHSLDSINSMVSRP